MSKVKLLSILINKIKFFFNINVLSNYYIIKHRKKVSKEYKNFSLFFMITIIYRKENK